MLREGADHGAGHGAGHVSDVAGEEAVEVEGGGLRGGVAARAVAARLDPLLHLMTMHGD